MSIQWAKRLAHVQSSITLKLSARANQLKAQGKPIINLTVGEPDQDTWLSIKEAACVAIADGFTKYTAVDGIVSLKQAIIQKFIRDNQLHYALDQIMVSNGAKQCIYNVMQALLNPGDEVIIPAPFWTSYPDMVLLAEAKPVIVSAQKEQYFKLTAEQLQKAITNKTRLLILNSPSNPTGMVYSRRELMAFADVLLQYPELIILNDDIYEHIYWGKEPFANIVQVCPALYERSVVINGVSKAYAMTGWRVGFAAGPKELIAAMTTIQSQSTSSVNSIAQMAAYAALTGDQTPLSEIKELYLRRHTIFYEGLNRITGIHCLPACGAFYCFAQVQEIMDKAGFTSDADFAEYLLEHAQVACVPGSAFGAPGYVRFSFAVDETLLQHALDAITSTLVSLT